MIGIETMVTEVFPGSPPTEVVPAEEVQVWRNFFAGMFRSVGCKEFAKVDQVEEWLIAEGRAPFIDMASALTDPVASRLEEVDLVLVCHFTPDLHLGTSVTNYVMHRHGIKAMAFAISDHGVSAPLLGLKIAGDYLRTGKARRVLILAMDQKLLAYSTPLIERVQPFNSATLLIASSVEAQWQVKDYAYGVGFDEALTRFELQPRQTVLVTNTQATEISVDWLEQHFIDERYLCSAPFQTLASLGARWREQSGSAKDVLVFSKTHSGNTTALHMEWRPKHE